jgi:hypothetical protein
MSDNNIYYSPEKFGLTTVATLDAANVSYEFYTIALWTDGQKFYWAYSSGCSCPCPFEEIGMDNVETGTYLDLAQYVRGLANSYSPWTVVEVMDFLADARKAMCNE